MNDDPRLPGFLADLQQHLTALDARVHEDDVVARSALKSAWDSFNRLARLIAPDLVVPDDSDDYDESENEEDAALRE